MDDGSGGGGGGAAPVEEKRVATVRRGVLDSEARAAYSAAYSARTDTSGGLGSMDAGLAGADLFEVVVDGVTVGRYALRIIDRAHGTELHIAAAAGGLRGVDLVESILPHVERQGAGADRVTVRTRRRGLMRKLQKQGWTVDGYIMGKKLK